MSSDQWLLEGESQTLEFKTSFDKATVESLVAFANAQGGTVLVGVSDAGEVQGVTRGKETLYEWLGQIKSATSPSLIPDLEATNVVGKTVVVIRVGEFPVKPVSTHGRYFKRVASFNHQLGLGEIADLYLQSLQLLWDAHESVTESLDSLSLLKINRFINQVNGSGRFALEGEPLAALEKLKYINHGQPTWAALLLSAKEPLRHHIHIGRFKTPSTIIDDRQITDTLFEAVDQAMKFIVLHISVAFEFDGSLQRKERFAYPLALREALLNAVVHRDYTNPSDIQIKIFDDSITFFSPGHFYGGLSLADIQTGNYQSHLRDKLLAEAFYLTNNIEKYGSGFIRIRKALQDYPDVSFHVQEMGGGVLLTFAQAADGRSDASNIISEKSSEKILALLRNSPTMSAREIAQHLNISQRAAEKQLDKLKREGRLRRVGSDRGGYWQVLEAS